RLFLPCLWLRGLLLLDLLLRRLLGASLRSPGLGSRCLLLSRLARRRPLALLAVALLLGVGERQPRQVRREGEDGAVGAVLTPELAGAGAEAGRRRTQPVLQGVGDGVQKERLRPGRPGAAAGGRRGRRGRGRGWRSPGPPRAAGWRGP